MLWKLALALALVGLTTAAEANGNTSTKRVYRERTVVETYERPEPFAAVSVLGGVIAVFDEPFKLIVDLDKFLDDDQVRVHVRDIIIDEDRPRTRKRKMK